MIKKINELEDHVHYLKLLFKYGAVYQPEIRCALQYAIKELERKEIVEEK